jgi:hypothetical protein
MKESPSNPGKIKSAKESSAGAIAGVTVLGGMGADINIYGTPAMLPALA